MSSELLEPVVICCAADEGYAIPLAAMIKSLLVNRHGQRIIELYIFDEGITEASKARLVESWAGDALTVHWLKFEPDKVAALPLWGEMKAIAYYKLMLPDYLPKALSNAIWLDSDMIIKGDITNLWETPLDGQALLAAQDLAIPYIGSTFGVAAYKALGIAPYAKYFNSAVMLINLNWWRENDLGGQVLAYLKRQYQTVYLWDQDGLNAVLAGRWGELDPRWNQIASICGRAFYRASHLPRDTYQLVINDPWIVHYAGTFKPWRYDNNNPSRALYFQYVDMTAWAGWRPPITFKRRLMGVYDSTLRNIFYPAEAMWIKLMRQQTIRRS
jgi:lipopolysaccharide biosynthesis glycosyltransferase